MPHYSESLVTETRQLDSVPHAPKRSEPIGFLLRLAKALHTYGLPAYELEHTMNGCANALGFGIQCMSLPTSISMTILPPDEPPQTFLIRVAPGGIRLDKLRRTTRVAQLVIQSKLSPKEGAKELKLISDSKQLYSSWIESIAFGVNSSAIAHIFSGGLYEMITAGLIGLLVGALATLSRKWSLLDHLLPTMSAFLATTLAIAVDWWIDTSFSVSLPIISGLIVLLPGLSLTIAMAELATQNMVSGTARLTGAATVFIQLAFGSALGVQLGYFLGVDFISGQPASVPFITTLLAAAIAGTALTPIFEAKITDALWFLLAALVAYLSVYFGTQLFGPSLGAFCGAIATGLFAKMATRFFQVPGAMIILPGFIILVPGSVGYRSMLALLDKDIIQGLTIAFDVAIIGVSLVAGFLISSMVPLPKDREKDHY